MTEKYIPTPEQCELVSHTLKTLAHPGRLLMLCLLSDGEKTVTELQAEAGISQSSASQFLQRMKSDGFVEARRDASHVYYSISDPRISKLVRAMNRIYCS